MKISCMDKVINSIPYEDIPHGACFRFVNGSDALFIKTMELNRYVNLSNGNIINRASSNMCILVDAEVCVNG